MYEITRDNKTVFGFAVRDTQSAWQVVQRYMSNKYYRPHEQIRDLYYTTAPGLGMQYLQFFKTENGIQAVTFFGGPVHPVPLGAMPPQTADSVRTSLAGLLEPLRAMEQAEAAGQPTASQQQPPGTLPNCAGAAPWRTDTEPTFGENGAAASRTAPQDPQGTRYAYDPVNGGPTDRASNAVAGLIFATIGLFLALIGMGSPVLGVLALIPLVAGLVLSLNGHRSRRRKMALGGLVICFTGIAVVILTVLVWMSILAG